MIVKQKVSLILATAVKTDGINSTFSGSITQYKDPDVEDVIHSDNGNVTESCEDKISQISEKQNEIVSIIPKSKSTEYIETNSRKEDKSANNNT